LRYVEESGKRMQVFKDRIDTIRRRFTDLVSSEMEHSPASLFQVGVLAGVLFNHIVEAVPVHAIGLHSDHLIREGKVNHKSSDTVLGDMGNAASIKFLFNRNLNRCRAAIDDLAFWGTKDLATAWTRKEQLSTVLAYALLKRPFTRQGCEDRSLVSEAALIGTELPAAYTGECISAHLANEILCALIGALVIVVTLHRAVCGCFGTVQIYRKRLSANLARLLYFTALPCRCVLSATECPIARMRAEAPRLTLWGRELFPAVIALLHRTAICILAFIGTVTTAASINARLRGRKCLTAELAGSRNVRPEVPEVAILRTEIMRFLIDLRGDPIKSLSAIVADNSHLLGESDMSAFPGTVFWGVRPWGSIRGERLSAGLANYGVFRHRKILLTKDGDKLDGGGRLAVRTGFSEWFAIPSLSPLTV